MSDVALNWRTMGRIEVARVARGAAIVVVHPLGYTQEGSRTQVNIYVHGRCTASMAVLHRDVDFWVQLASNVCVSQTERAAIERVAKTAPRPRNRHERRIVLAKTVLRQIQGGKL